MEFEFTRNTLMGEYYVKCSMGHEIVGRWLQEEIGKDKQKLDKELDDLEEEKEALEESKEKLKDKKEKRKSPVTKNEQLRAMIAQAIHNQLIFKYVLADSWFASAENMRYIKSKKKCFIFDMKKNRMAALNEKDRNAGRWTRIDELNIPDNTPVKVWLKDLEFPLLLTKQVFKNKDNSKGVRFLVSNDFNLSDDDFTRLYKKRWSVEEYHKSLKQNTGIAKSPTRTLTTQTNHIFSSIMAYVKLEKLKFASKLNQFALKSKIYLAANKAAFKELAILKASALFA